jgi:hypothetical protein
MLVSEFRIRQELSALEAMPGRPFGKAKKILRLARYVGMGSARMAQLANWYLSLGDIGRAAKFERARHRLIRLHDEIRAKARNELECKDLVRSRTNGAEAV